MFLTKVEEKVQKVARRRGEKKRRREGGGFSKRSFLIFYSKSLTILVSFSHFSYSWVS